MALQPSRRGFILAGALVFLALPFLRANFARASVDKRFMAVGVAMVLVCLMLTGQYRRQLRARASAPPAA